MTSRTRLTLGLIGLLALALPTATASAAELAAELQGGYFGLAATKSADAILESTGGFTWGGAVRYTFHKGFFATAGFRTFSRSGERAFVAGPADPVARLGFPLTVRISPVYLTAGYRFRDGKLVVPYVGLGGSLTSYSEESSVAGVTYDVSSTKAGFHAAGGVEVGRGRFRFGAEAGWSTVPNAIGVGGVSDVYDEDDIGGWTVLGKVVIALGGKKAPAEGEEAVEAEEPADEDGPPEPEA